MSLSSSPTRNSVAASASASGCGYEFGRLLYLLFVLGMFLNLFIECVVPVSGQGSSSPSDEEIVYQTARLGTVIASVGFPPAGLLTASFDFASVLGIGPTSRAESVTLNQIETSLNQRLAQHQQESNEKQAIELAINLVVQAKNLFSPTGLCSTQLERITPSTLSSYTYQGSSDPTIGAYGGVHTNCIMAMTSVLRGGATTISYTHTIDSLQFFKSKTAMITFLTGYRVLTFLWTKLIQIKRLLHVGYADSLAQQLDQDAHEAMFAMMFIKLRTYREKLLQSLQSNDATRMNEADLQKYQTKILRQFCEHPVAIKTMPNNYC